MACSPLNIPTIDCSRDDADALIAALRDKLSPRGNVVSEAGKQRTIELFGAAALAAAGRRAHLRRRPTGRAAQPCSITRKSSTASS